jgi:hypothetical protein
MEMYKNPGLHSIIPLAEMIYARDYIVYHFDPSDASAVNGTVKSRADVRQIFSRAASFQFSHRHSSPEYRGTLP